MWKGILAGKIRQFRLCLWAVLKATATPQSVYILSYSAFKRTLHQCGRDGGISCSSTPPPGDTCGHPPSQLHPGSSESLPASEQISGEICGFPPQDPDQAALLCLFSIPCLKRDSRTREGRGMDWPVFTL